MTELDATSARDFGRVLAAEGISNFGGMLSRLAIPWVATLLLDATPWQMGLLLVADIVAAALGALLLGGAVDRVAKRRVMVAADLGNGLVLGAVALLAGLQALSFAVLLVASAARGVLAQAFELARSAWMAQRLAGAGLSTRNARLALVGSLSETAAFALGGWLFQWLGAVVALAVDALSYAVSALTLRGVADVAPQAAGSDAKGAIARACDDAAAGLRVVFAHRQLRAIAMLEVLLALVFSVGGTSYMIFVARDIGFDTGWQGLIFALGGAGAVAGAALAPALGRRIGPGRAMAAGLALFALGAACIPLVDAPGLVGAALLAVHQVVGDAGHTVHAVHDRTLRQTAAPPALPARVDAGLRAIGQAATLAGALGGGALATVFGTRPMLVLSALIAVLAAGLAAFTLGRSAG